MISTTNTASTGTSTNNNGYPFHTIVDFPYTSTISSTAVSDSVSVSVSASSSSISSRSNQYTTTDKTVDCVRLPSNFVPGPMDVICNRGRKALNHCGNKRFRNMINRFIPMYAKAVTKTEKSKIVTFTIETVVSSSSTSSSSTSSSSYKTAPKPAPPTTKTTNTTATAATTTMLEDEKVQEYGSVRKGMFIREHEDGIWYKVSDHCAREKCGQIFRDLLYTKYKSSTKAKSSRRKQLEQQQQQHNNNNICARTLSSTKTTPTTTTTLLSNIGIVGVNTSRTATNVDDNNIQRTTAFHLPFSSLSSSSSSGMNNAITNDNHTCFPQNQNQNQHRQHQQQQHLERKKTLQEIFNESTLQLFLQIKKNQSLLS